MFNTSSVLLTDFYKQVHAEQYDPSIVKLVSYYTPRMSRLKGIDTVPVIGNQAFIQEYLIDHFNENFFNKPLNEIVADYEYTIRETMGENRVNSEKIVSLHNLGYLPLEIRALDEGTMCPIKVPMIEISNTHPDFAWCTNLIESVMSCELWFTGCTATTAIMYRNIVNKYYNATSDNLHLRKSAMSEFGFRGLPGLAGAMKASMGFLTAFNKTATIPSIKYVNYAYGDDLKDIGSGMASTEHSVMCSSFSIDQDERILIKKLLTEIYPDGNFSMVCDSYDYWNVVENILPTLKEEILSRKGTVYVRGDSGDPVNIVTETVFKLWNIFGGTINSKGFKVLDSHVRAIYGDSITPNRAEKIYQVLMVNGFSVENVSLGAGSFSMLCLEREVEEVIGVGVGCEDITETFIRLAPYTRDTFGVAIKTTYGEYESERIEGSICGMSEITPFPIFKDPITDSGFKKSQKGCIVVYLGNDNKIHYIDEYSLERARELDSINLLKPVFKDGEFINKTSFNEIRTRLWGDDF